MNETRYSNMYEMILGKITVFFAIIAAIALTIMMLLTAADVILRIWGTAIVGSFELVEFLMAIVVPLSIAYCEKKRQHICVDLIVQNFPKKVQPWFDLITSIITVVLYFVIVSQCWLYIGTVKEDQLTSSVLLWDVWPFTIPCVIGFLLTALLLIDHCAKVIKQISRGDYGTY